MAYKLISSLSKRDKKLCSDKPCHQSGYRFRHVIYELLQLRSIITMTLTVSLIAAVFYVVVIGEFAHSEIIITVLVPLTTMALTSLFRKDKGD